MTRPSTYCTNAQEFRSLNVAADVYFNIDYIRLGRKDVRVCTSGVPTGKPIYTSPLSLIHIYNYISEASPLNNSLPVTEGCVSVNISCIVLYIVFYNFI